MICDFVLCIFLLTAAYFDSRQFKIPNKMIIAGVLTAIILNTITYGLKGLKVSLFGGVVAFILGFFMWKLKVFKAGDAKLLMMIGFFEGIEDMWMPLCAAIIAAGILSLFLMVRNHQLKSRLQRVWLHFKLMFMRRKYEGYVPVDNDQIKMPFAVPVFIGILIYKIFMISREGVLL